MIFYSPGLRVPRYTEDYSGLKSFPSKLTSDNASDNLRLEMISTSCCRKTPLVFTGVALVLSGRHPTPRTGAHLVSPAARGNKKALSEIMIGSGSERITRNYILHLCSTPLPSDEVLENKPGKSRRHSSRLHTAQSQNTSKKYIVESTEW